MIYSIQDNEYNRCLNIEVIHNSTKKEARKKTITVIMVNINISYPLKKK